MHQPPTYWLPTLSPNIYRSAKGDAIQYTKKEVIYWQQLSDPRPYSRYPLTVSQKFLELVSSIHG